MTPNEGIPMRRPFLALPLLLAMLLPAFASADEYEAVTFDPSRFAAQKAAIESDLSEGLYSELSRTNRDAVRSALARIEAAVAGKSRISELDDATRVQVFNDQELINTTLTQAAEDSRVVCRREKKLGSNMPTNVCMTVAERRRAMEHAQQQTRNFNRSSLPRVQ